MICKIRTKLKRELHDATSEFSDVVAALTGPYVALMDKAEAARLASENARAAMDIHRAAHGC